MIKGIAQVGLPEKAGVFKPGTQHAFPAALDHAHVLGGKVQHGEKMRQQFAIGPFDAKALLVAFHAGEQYFARHLKIGRIKIGQQRHRVLGKALHFVQQAVFPQHLATSGSRLGIPPLNGDIAALGRINGNGAGPGEGGQKFIGMRHSKGANAVDAVPAGLTT